MNLTGLLTLSPIVAFGIHYPDTFLIIISTPDSLFYQVSSTNEFLDSINKLNLKITLYNTLTIALDRFMMFITPWV